MRHSVLACLLGLSSLAGIGCGDKPPPPGNINWSVRHDGRGIEAKIETDRDMRGSMYSCLFEKDPFAYPGQPLLQEQKADLVDMNAPDTVVPGQAEGGIAFGGLSPKKTYTLVVFLDDEGDNSLKRCVDGKGMVLVSNRDPITIQKNIVVMSMLTTTVTLVFDHRFENGI